MPASLSIEVGSASRLFKALSDDTRLRIVALLGQGELCVGHLEDALGLTQSHVSRHLAVLKSAGVVEARRSGTWVLYKLAAQPDAACEKQLKTFLLTLPKRDALKRGVAQLLKTRGPGA